jgi:mono/diheme cytochrome c family protein
LRQLPHEFPREAQKLKAAAFAILLVLSGSCSAGAVELQAAARGAYLAAAAGCGQCHTDSKRGGRPYAGGRELETQFGTLVTPNITSDRRTGIGRWRLADFTRAMRWGVAPDNSHYLPAFPFPYYNRLSERDLADLKAFLDNLPAVSQVNGAGNRARFAAASGAVVVLASSFPGPWRPDPTKDAQSNRGAYLVVTIGRCGDCHTPRNRLGAPDPDRALGGAAAGRGGHAGPNITSDPETGIGRWSIDDIVTLLSDGQKPDFDFVGGAMGEIVNDTAHLDDADRRAIAVYLKSLPPIVSPKKD